MVVPGQFLLGQSSDQPFVHIFEKNPSGRKLDCIVRIVNVSLVVGFWNCTSCFQIVRFAKRVTTLKTGDRWLGWIDGWATMANI